MIKLLVRAHDLKRKLLQGSWDSLLELARAEGLKDSYATRLLRLAYLAPSIVDTIIDGRQSPELSAIILMRGDLLPMDWQGQRVRLGYA
jgi:site-specific DNA recombinase